MGLPSTAAASHRDPVNELYDCAGQLVQAARELSVAATRPGTAPALAATLGCLETSLEAPSQCIDSAHARIHEQPPRNRVPAAPGARSALADLEVLRQELDQASRAAGAARRTVGPLVAEAEPG